MYVVIVAFVLIIIGLFFWLSEKNVSNKEETKEIEIDKEKNNYVDYVKPKFKEFTQEQIDDIHARGKITPAEQVKEWEGMDLCAPGDAIGSAAWRCRKFRNCHDCLVDYANQHDEYTSFFDILKECKPYKI